MPPARLPPSPSFSPESPQLLRGNCSFVIGYDTCLRLLQSKYYSDSTPESALAHLQASPTSPLFRLATVFLMHGMQASGCSFKVAGRVATAFPAAQTGAHVASDSFLRLEHLRHLIPGFAAEMFTEISERDCRVDVSSSQLRAAAGAAERKG